MKLINPFRFALVLSLLSAGFFQPACAVTTEADQDKLRIHTGMPAKASDALFAYTVEWRIDDGEIYRATGLSFFNATKISPTANAIIAKRLVNALKDGLVQVDPGWRGINVSQPKDQPELIVANKTGNSIATVTVRDYSNQALSYDLTDKSFNEGGVQVAIDLVLAVDIEYVEGISSIKPQTASQGDIEISIDNQTPINIKTDGKTTRELEEEIAKQLSASHLSETPLYPALSTDSRNFKAFDGSEVQLLNLAAHSLAIKVNDPSLGVLTKFKFKDENYSVKVIEPRFMFLAVVMIGILAAGYFGYQKYIKKA